MIEDPLMIEDPIVEETREARAKLFESCGSSLERLMEHLQAAQEKDRPRLVADPRKLVPTQPVVTA